MSIFDALIVFFAAVLGGALNSVAGGGSFILFPVLVFTGVPPVNANATNTAALWPGAAASMVAYRREMMQQKASLVVVLGVTSLIGGILGSVILLRTPQDVFSRLVPYLLLFATLLFTFNKVIVDKLKRSRGGNPPPVWLTYGGIAIVQLVIATYGGFFGGGIGILMLATLGVFGMTDINSMNSLKVFFATLINGISVVIFIVAGLIYWPQAVVGLCGGITGGYGGASIARKIKPIYVRRFVILVGFTMTIYFFIRG